MRWAVPILLCASVAHAGTVRGTVALPPDNRAPEGGHWRVENGVLPIAARTPDPRSEVVVVLEGGTKKAEPRPVNVEIRGLRLDPKIVVLPVGSTVTFRNSDRLPHALYLENARGVMAPEATPAGQTRQVRLMAASDYQVRDQEFPHVEGVLLAVESPYTAQVDERGSFKIEAPEGKYTLKVYWRGAWALEQRLEVGPRSMDIALQLPQASAKPRTTGRGD